MTFICVERFFNEMSECDRIGQLVNMALSALNRATLRLSVYHSEMTNSKHKQRLINWHDI